MRMIKIIRWVGVVFLTFVLVLGLLGCGGSQVYNPQAMGDIEGTVTDKETEGPLGGATVTVEGTGWSASTEDDGSYSISDVEAGTYDITTSKSGYINQTETVTVEDNTTVDFELIALVQYDLTIGSTAGVSVITPGEGTFTYDAGTVVDLMATPGDGYRFVEWTGDVGTIADVEAAATNITMSGNYTITANFAMEATPVRVDSITYKTEGGPNKVKHLDITVLLLDNLENPVADASVSATLYRDDESSWDFQETTTQMAL